MSPEWILHKGKRILFIDYSACSTLEEGFSLVDNAKAAYDKSPVKIDVLVNCDSRLSVHQEFVKKVSELASYSKGIDKVSKKAVLGLEGLKMVFYRTYQMINKDAKTMVFNTKEEALEWLAS